LLQLILRNPINNFEAEYRLIGQEVESVIDGEMTAGYHSVEWNAGSMPSGLYIYRLTAGDLVETRKLVLMK